MKYGLIEQPPILPINPNIFMYNLIQNMIVFKQNEQMTYSFLIDVENLKSFPTFY